MGDLTEIKVRDVMTKSLISADPGTTVYQIAKIMEQGIGAILIKKDGEPAGIITDRDFAIKIAVNKTDLNTPVENIASYPLVTVNADDSIISAASTMSSKRIRKLAVVDDGKVIGIITSTDLVNQISKN